MGWGGDHFRPSPVLPPRNFLVQLIEVVRPDLDLTFQKLISLFCAASGNSALSRSFSKVCLVSPRRSSAAPTINSTSAQHLSTLPPSIETTLPPLFQMFPPSQRSSPLSLSTPPLPSVTPPLPPSTPPLLTSLPSMLPPSNVANVRQTSNVANVR